MAVAHANRSGDDYEATPLVGRIGRATSQFGQVLFGCGQLMGARYNDDAPNPREFFKGRKILIYAFWRKTDARDASCQ